MDKFTEAPVKLAISKALLLLPPSIYSEKNSSVELLDEPLLVVVSQA